MTIDLATTSNEDFAPHVGSGFTLTGAEPAVTLTLTEATALKAHSPDLRLPFSLLFSTPDTRVFQQDNYVLHHDILGDVEVFLCPRAKTDAAVIYEACFN